jgi:hypothetical protein
MGIARGSGAPEGLEVRVVLIRPVELVPASSRAVDNGDRFDGVAGLSRLDVREP